MVEMALCTTNFRYLILCMCTLLYPERSIQVISISYLFLVTDGGWLRPAAGSIQCRCTFAATGCGSALVWDVRKGLYSTGFGHSGRRRQEQRMATESLVPATESKEAVERRKT